MSLRVRFAPSPTGFLHVGGLRTALYNYLFARQQGGAFLLRIEDTDRKRFVEGALENLIASLRWAGIDFDEGPGKEGNCGSYLQSERLEIYRKYALQLIDKGHAYYAFDSPEDLEAMRQEQQKQPGVTATRYDRKKMKNSLTCSEVDVQRWLNEDVPYVIRMRCPEEVNTLSFEDVVRGRLEFGPENLEDQVLLKTDGFPTYHLASVVDDHLMGITHVIRGEEWLTSVPKHLLLYDFFGWEPPVMAHLPLLLNSDRSKLSKRQSDVAVEDYREQGYLPQALVNFVAMLGWSPGDDQEIFSLDEMIERFSLERVNKSGAVFDLDKLKWFNKQHLRLLAGEDVLKEARPLLEEAGYSIPSDDYLLRVINLLVERLTFVHDLVPYASYFFQDPDTYDEKTKKKRWKADAADLCLAYAERLESLDSFTEEQLEQTLRTLAEEKGVGGGKVIHPTRLAVTGFGVGPSLFALMEVVGQEACIRRLRQAAERLG